MPSLPLQLYLVWATHGRKLWEWSSFCGVISLIITLTKVRKMIIESIPTALRSAISAGIGIFLAYVGIKNAGFLKFTIDPHTYTVVGKEQIRRMQRSQPMHLLFLDWLILTIQLSSWPLLVLQLLFSLLSKGLREDYPFYLSNDCAWNSHPCC